MWLLMKRVSGGWESECCSLLHGTMHGWKALDDASDDKPVAHDAAPETTMTERMHIAGDVVKARQRTSEYHRQRKQLKERRSWTGWVT